MSKLEQIIEEYLFAAMSQGIILDMDNQTLDNEFFPDIVVMMMNEEVLSGRLSNGLVGYVLALGYGITDMKVMVPREVSLACLELLRPYAQGDRPDLLEVVTRCDRANNKFLTGKDIEESGADNVTQLH